MKITIEIYKSSFNDEWNCDIYSSENGKDETEHWAVEDFCELLKLVAENFPNSKLVGKDSE